MSGEVVAEGAAVVGEADGAALRAGDHVARDEDRAGGGVRGDGDADAALADDVAGCGDVAAESAPAEQQVRRSARLSMVLPVTAASASTAMP